MLRRKYRINPDLAATIAVDITVLMYRRILYRSLARGLLQPRAPARSLTLMINDNSKRLDHFMFVGHQRSGSERARVKFLANPPSLAPEASNQTPRSCPPSLPSPTLYHGADLV